MLRSRIVSASEDAAQLVLDASVELSLPVDTVTAVDQAAWEAAMQEHASREAAMPFALAHDRLLRARLICRAGHAQALLLLTVHHCVADDWSLQLLIDELADSYQAQAAGRTATLPTLPIQYLDYSLWLREPAQVARQREQLAYWRATLEPGDYVLELPTDHPRTADLAMAAGTCTLTLPADLVQGLRQYARTRGVTLYTVLLAALDVLLGRYANQRDVRVGTAVANRALTETQSLIGCFVNTLVIRADLAPALPFDDFVVRLQEQVLAAQEHQDVPFEQVVGALATERNLAQTPLFQVLFVMQNARLDPAQWPGLTVRERRSQAPAAKLDLSWEVHDDQQQVSVVLEFRRALFELDTMSRWLAQWQRLLGQILAAPATRLGALDVLTSAERHQQLVTWNDTAKAYPGPHTLAHALEAQRLCTPDAPALSYENITLSYAALHNRADRLAHALRSRGIGRETIIGVCMERSVELVVALLGVVKAGAAYLPLDPELPPARLAFLLADAQAPLVLTQPHLHGQLSVALPDTIPVLSLDAAAVPDWLAAQPAHAPVLDNEPADLAYVIYTSGSTGQPKGVLNEHGALMNRLWWMQDAFPIDAADRVLQKTPYSFDVSVWEFFWPLITGAHLVLARPDGHRDSGYLVALIQQFHITTLHFVPSMLQAFLHEPGLPACSSLRQVFSSGEALPWEPPAALLRTPSSRAHQPLRPHRSRHRCQRLALRPRLPPRPRPHRHSHRQSRALHPR